MQIYRRLHAIKALSFDLDDTLYDNHPIIQKVETEMIIWLHKNHPLSAKLSIQQWKQIKFDLLAISPELKHDVTLWRQVHIEQGLKQLGYDDLKAKTSAMEGIKHALWLRNQIDVPEASHHVLQALSKKFPLVAITNGNVDVNKIGLNRYFKLVLKSGPDGKSKPNSDMFVAAANSLKLEHHQILHIGDHLISDVSGAKRCGFNACWLNTKNKSIMAYERIQELPDIEIQDISELLALL